MIDTTRNFQTFQPRLLRAEVSADTIDFGSTLWVTLWWQNTGDAPAARSLNSWLSLRYGHQRITEPQQKTWRVEWTPFPHTTQWGPGEIWATTCRLTVPELWGGTYRLTVGLCDGEKTVPHGNGQGIVDGSPIGEIDVGWGWGRPAVDEQTRPFVTTIAPPQERPAASARPTPWDATGSEPEDSPAPDTPVQRAALTAFSRAVSAQFAGAAGALFCREQPPEIRARHPLRGETVQAPAALALLAEEADGLRLRADLIREGKRLAGCVLRCTQEADCLTVSLEESEAAEGWELLEVRFPALVCARGEDARLVHMYNGGREVSVADSRPIGYVQPYDIRGCAALLAQGRALLLETAGLDNRLEIAVEQNPQERYASLGMVLTAAVEAGGHAPSLPTGGASFTLKGLPASGWQEVARELQQGLEGKHHPLYQRAMVYKQLVCYGPRPAARYLTSDAPYSITRLCETYSFADVLRRGKRMYHLTDGFPQVVYMVGWQYQGHDTGYPHVLEVNPRVGTLDQLRACIEEGRAYNAVISLHDNYDDAYLSSPWYDPEIVARDETGGPYKGWIWTGGLSHIISMKRYLRSGKAAERVRQTIERFGIRQSYHLDVLSSEVIRHDFGPDGGAADDCLAWRRKLIAEFNRYGVDVTSETLTHPFADVLGFAYSTRDDFGRDLLFTGERYIPLAGMVYHGVIPYNAGGTRYDDILRGLLLGGGGKYDDVRDRVTADELRVFYLQTLPMSLLSGKRIRDVQERADGVRVVYDEDSAVTVCPADGTFEVVCGGRTVARDGGVFAPGIRPGVYLAYACRVGRYVWELPAQWDPARPVRAVSLTEDGEGAPVPVRITDGQVELELAADTPVKVWAPA